MGKNYCLIKEQYDNLFSDAIVQKDKKKVRLLKSALTENKDFQKLYTLVENLQGGTVKPERCAQFVDENIKMAKKVRLNSFNALAEGLGACKVENPLTEHINRILFETKSIVNIEDWENSYSIVCEHLKSVNKVEGVTFEQKVKELTPLFEQLDDTDKKLISEFAKIPVKDREIAYNSLLEECVGLLNEQLNGLPKTNLSLDQYKYKSELLETKDRIRESSFDSKDYIGKTIKLHTLKKNIISG